MRIPDDRAEMIAERMTRSIDTIDLMNIYDPIEYSDPIEGLKETIKNNPLAVMELLSELIDETR